MNMASLCVFTLLVVSAAAQVPAPPIMSNTFQGSGEVEMHTAEMTDIGTFEMARDQEKEMGMEKEMYKPMRPGALSISQQVELYSMNKTYYFRQNSGSNEGHCLEENRNFTGMPKYWDWLSIAKYEGTDTVREVKYDLWGITVADVRFEFGQPQSNASILYFYRRKSPEISVLFSFMKYETTPDPSIFSLPKECTN